jgi:hypothetical protein
VQNDSTYEFVNKSLASLNRLALLGRSTKLYCSECREMRRLTDYFSLSQIAVLGPCAHRRPINLRSESEIAAFKQTTEERARKRLILSKRDTRVFEEDMEAVWPN